MPRKSTSSHETDIGDGGDEKAAMGGLLRSIQNPLSSIGRIFADDSPTVQGNGPARTPLKDSSPRLSPAPRRSTDRPLSPQRPTEASHDAASRNRVYAGDAATIQASTGVAEAHRLQSSEHENVVETLCGMFPDLDRELISDVVVQKNGRYVPAVPASSGYMY